MYIGIRLRLLDIGGGYPGLATKIENTTHSNTNSNDSNEVVMPPLTLEDVALEVNKAITELFPVEDNNNLTSIQIISEPGR
jgi:hypothetical protein